jgi:hypothetical protein
MSSVDAVIDTEKFSDWLELKTAIAKKCLNKQLSNWSTDEKHLSSLSSRLARFKAAFKQDPHFYDTCAGIFQEVAECEKELTKLINTNSDLEKESYSELLFFRPILKPLNFIPYLLSIWAVIRVYVLPGLSFIIPILTLLAPYIILKFVFNIPMTINNYINMLNSLLSGNFSEAAHLPSSQGPSFTPDMLIKKLGFVLITIIQGIVQPYWTYKHLKSIDDIVNTNGAIIVRFRNLYERLSTELDLRGFKFFKCPLPHIGGVRDAMARAIIESSYFKLALKYIGSLEVIMALAHKPEINPVKWIKSPHPVFIAKNTFDFQVPEKQRRTISATFNTKRHALLTGPNKGGKSTVLRALSISALLAHTYGCGMGNTTLTVFHKMFVCLKPDDLPGSKSRFEREIEFTAATLKHTQPILIFIDELYHSTNPPDALRSCQVYCSQLWRKTNMISVISTHLFELVETADKSIQCLCCPANISKTGDVMFEYTLKSGICKVSSVDELLKMNGLSAPDYILKIPTARQNDVSK